MVIFSVGTVKVEGLFTSPITVTLKLRKRILTIGSFTYSLKRKDISSIASSLVRPPIFTLPNTGKFISPFLSTRYPSLRGLVLTLLLPVVVRMPALRSEERRVGKECWFWFGP